VDPKKIFRIEDHGHEVEGDENESLQQKRIYSQKIQPENRSFNLIVRMHSKSIQLRSRSDISESLLHFSNPKDHGWLLGTGYLQQPVRDIYKIKKIIIINKNNKTVFLSVSLTCTSIQFDLSYH